MKNYYNNNSKAFKAFISSTLYTKNTKSFDKAWKNKNKKQQKDKQDSTNPVIRVKVTNINDKNKKRRT